MHLQLFFITCVYLNQAFAMPKRTKAREEPQEEFGSNCLYDFPRSFQLDQQTSSFQPFDRFIFEHIDEVPLETALMNADGAVQIGSRYRNTPEVHEGNLGGVYKFLQAQFHWGDAQSRVLQHEVDGRIYPLEMHILFFNEKYGDAREALKHDDGISVMVVLYKDGPVDNPVVDRLTKELPKIPHTGAIVNVETPYSLLDMLPFDRTSFYRYRNNLPAPHCDKMATWTVFHSALPISFRQLNKFEEKQRRVYAMKRSGKAAGRQLSQIQRSFQEDVSYCNIPYICPVVNHLAQILFVVGRSLFQYPRFVV